MGLLFKKRKEKNEQRVLSSVQRGWSIYIGINIVFLLPWTLLLVGDRFFSLNIDLTLPKALEIMMIFICLSAAMNLYWVFCRSLHFGMKG